jgi:hypothetical protein
MRPPGVAYHCVGVVYYCSTYYKAVLFVLFDTAVKGTFFYLRKGNILWNVREWLMYMHSPFSPQSKSLLTPVGLF